jgi:hypothetical protein
MSSIRSSHSPPWLFTESHDSKALKTLPKCMRPVGDGAKRPFSMSAKVRRKNEKNAIKHNKNRQSTLK